MPDLITESERIEERDPQTESETLEEKGLLVGDCPFIDKALPSWPAARHEDRSWTGLHKDFRYTHHPLNKRHVHPQYYAITEEQYYRLHSVLASSEGGSILVSGYRGTGKTSLVNYTVRQLINTEQGEGASDGEIAQRLRDQGNKLFIPIRINLSVARNSHALASLMLEGLYDQLVGEHKKEVNYGQPNYSYDRFESVKNRLREAYTYSRSATQISKGKEDKISSKVNASIGIPQLSGFGSEIAGESSSSESRTSTYDKLALHELQSELKHILDDVSNIGCKVLFIFDELDKLEPKESPGRLRLSRSFKELQSIVSDLKFLLTEANAFSIFIAGKDADDSWQEDQNKGEGLLESVFLINVYLPTTFSAKFRPPIGPNLWIIETFIKFLDANYEKLTCYLKQKPSEKECKDCSAIDLNSMDRDVEKKELESLSQKIDEKKRIADAKNGSSEGSLIEIDLLSAFSNDLPENSEELNKLNQSLLEFYHQTPTRILEDFYKAILRELGIARLTWTYNTALFIIPLFAEIELKELIQRLVRNHYKEEKDPFYGNKDDAKKLVNKHGILLAALIDGLRKESRDIKRDKEEKIEKREKEIEWLLERLKGETKRASINLDKFEREAERIEKQLRKQAETYRWKIKEFREKYKKRADEKVKKAEEKAKEEIENAERGQRMPDQGWIKRNRDRAASKAKKITKRSLWKARKKGERWEKRLEKTRKKAEKKRRKATHPGQRLEALEKERDEARNEKEQAVKAMSERECRNLRILLYYLTYKGRGIPRKILREFYTLIRHKSIIRNFDKRYSYLKPENINHIAIVSRSYLQKMTFFSSFVTKLESVPVNLRHLDDKGLASIFHIIDYILKYFHGGFTWKDIEHAGFLTKRQDIFPSKQLVRHVLSILEGSHVESFGIYTPAYRLLPRVVHDLHSLYLTFGPEQIELRSTYNEHADEIATLEKSSDFASQQAAENRLDSFLGQIRLGQIYEEIGNLPQARMVLAKALRWIRLDISRLYDKEDIPNEESVNRPQLNTFLSHAIESMHSLGHVCEQLHDFSTATLYYREALGLHTAYAKQIANFTKSPNRANAFLQDHIAPFGSLEQAMPFPPPFHQSDHSQTKEPEDVVKNLFPDRINIGPPLSIPLSRIRFDNFEFKSPLVSPIEPDKIFDSLNHIAFCLEKEGHRIAANKHFLLALARHFYVNDEFSIIEQSLLIASILVQRRDFKNALDWYIRAYRVCQESGWQDRKRFTTKSMPTLKIKALILNKIGDLNYATRGLGFIEDNKELRSISTLAIDPKSVEDLVDLKAMAFIMDLEGLGSDDRREEYFYTHAQILFRSTDDQMYANELYLKKLRIRREDILKSLKCSPKTDGLAKIVFAWGSLWSGAESILDSLLDSRPVVRQAHPLRWGESIDKRLLARLATIIGETYIDLSKIDYGNPKLIKTEERLLKYFLVEPGELIGKRAKEIFNKKKEKRFEAFKPFLEEDLLKRIRKRSENLLDTSSTDRRIFRIISFVNDNPDILECSRSEKRAPEPDPKGKPKPEEPSKKLKVQIHKKGIRSLLWRVSRPSTYPYATKRNKYIIEEKLNIGNLLEFFHDYYNKLDCLSKREEMLILRLQLAKFAENFLLFGYLTGQYEIKDIDSAQTSLALGKTYLMTIKYMIQFVAKEDSETERDKDKDTLEAKASFGGKLSKFYEILHLSAKRFLVNAIDIINAESRKDAVHLQILSEGHVQLGYLMLIRHQFIGFVSRKNQDPLFNPKNREWELKSEFNRDLLDDREIDDLQFQVNNAFLDAARHLQLELTGYLDRFPISKDIYYKFGNVDDRRTHFEIAHATRMRTSFDEISLKETPGKKTPKKQAYAKETSPNDKDVDKPAEIRRKHLNSTLSKLSFLTSKKPNVYVEETSRWLKELKPLVDDIVKLSTVEPIIQIDDDGNASWHSEMGRNKDSYWFAHFNDGIGRSAK